MEVRDLGLAEYAEVWALQKELVSKRQRGEIEDTLLLCEHPPVYTRGRSSRAPVPPSLPHPIHTVERGGDITWHGPGQLIGYPILDLHALDLTAGSYLRALEQALVEGVRPLGLEAATIRGFTGLWAAGRKIASIGVAVSGGVSYHGFSLNVSCDLAGFGAIHPCNLQPEQLATLRGLTGKPVTVDEARPHVLAALRRRLRPAVSLA